MENAVEPEYELTFEDRGPYLYVRVKAEPSSLTTAVGYLNKIMARLRVSGHRKAILFRDTPMNMTERQFRIAAAILINLMPANARLAIVDLSPSFETWAKVLAQIARESGREVKVFRDLRAGQNWLPV